MKITVDNDYLNNDKETSEEFQNYIDSLLSVKDISSMKILYVCDASYLQTKMSRVRFWAIEHLSKHPDVSLYLTGPGFSSFDASISLQENIIAFNIPFDLVVWYKPLNDNYNFDHSKQLPFKTCLRYNEMWDEEWTRKEIDESNTNIIISHHYNDFLKYEELYKDVSSKKLFYIPHCANPDVFKPLGQDKSIDILISGITKEKHYPLKYRLSNLIIKEQENRLKDFNIHVHRHPSYKGTKSFQNVNQINYNEVINKATLCLACTSKYKYRLGKYVEIPMAGSIVLGDIPFEDNRFNDFVVELNDQMSDDEIIQKIISTLKNKKMIEKYRNKGLEWASEYTVQKYVERFIQVISPKKIFVISDEIRDNHPEFKNQKWICDILKKEFQDCFPEETTYNAQDADIIWYLAPWNHRFTPKGFTRDQWLQNLKEKRVIFTQHHIDLEKVYLNQLAEQFKFMREYGNVFHAICDITKENMKYYLEPSKTHAKKLWINSDIFYHIPKKTELRETWEFKETDYLIGSFQKDTEGKSNLPKISKGPDMFVNIVKDMFKENKNIVVVLTGLRREYIIQNLEKLGIPYKYFNMISLEQINELYNCLDLYIVSSRCEGGPRSVFEAGLTKTPIISTKIGISPELMSEQALFDHNDWTTYKKTVPDSETLLKNVSRLMSKEYMGYFKDFLLYIE